MAKAEADSVGFEKGAARQHTSSEFTQKETERRDQQTEGLAYFRMALSHCCVSCRQQRCTLGVETHSFGRDG